jgi:hypothetical protein
MRANRIRSHQKQREVVAPKLVDLRKSWEFNRFLCAGGRKTEIAASVKKKRYITLAEIRPKGTNFLHLIHIVKTLLQ